MLLEFWGPQSWEQFKTHTGSTGACYEEWLHQRGPYSESEVIYLQGSHTYVFICGSENKDEEDMGFGDRWK